MVNRASSGRFARKPDTEVDRKTSTRSKRARRDLDDSDPNKPAAGGTQSKSGSNNELYDTSAITSPPKKKVLRSHGPVEPLDDPPTKLSTQAVLGKLPTRPKKATQQQHNIKRETQEPLLPPPPPALQPAAALQQQTRPLKQQSQPKLKIPPRPPSAKPATARPSAPRKRLGDNGQRRKKVKIDHEDEALLKPPKPTEHAEKRTLRSAAGTSRSRSGLALFFPDYEDHVFGPDKEPAYVDVSSTLFLTKDTRNPDEKPSSPKSPAKGSPQKLPKSPKSPRLSTPALKRSKAATKSTDFETVDLDEFKEAARQFDEDPLSDEVFIVAHRRGERKEKQMRNIEKEYARHERSELERLLEELQGPDWLRTMGISGVTDTEKKSYEPKRDHYVRGVKGLLQKFVTWDQQEKVLKLQREQKLAAMREAEEEEEGDDEEEGSGVEIADSEGDPPPSFDTDD